MPAKAVAHVGTESISAQRLERARATVAVIDAVLSEHPIPASDWLAAWGLPVAPVNPTLAQHAKRALVGVYNEQRHGSWRLKGIYRALSQLLAAYGLCLSPKYLANVAYYGRKLNEKGVGR